MTKVCVRSFSVSLDGYGAGVRQSMDEPIGVGGDRLHEWQLATQTFRRRTGQEGGGTGVDDGYVRRHLEDSGATIMGRNMFGPPQGGPWEGDSWRGWWGETPPWGYPVFILTHHPRASVEMKGGTTFHFVTGGVHEAVERAREAAGDKDVLVSGGVATIRQLLRERLIDQLDLAVVPVLLGEGERLLGGLGGDVERDYRFVRVESTDAVTHVRLQLQRADAA